ncbi:MAG: tripartite tricarboxylate transporter substrate binding protein [Defluviitaleaceae bacterium]|nr:tripartite tricarboxylate transporter substrate binding protein [Defluviitaleaceae bacterium]
MKFRIQTKIAAMLLAVAMSAGLYGCAAPATPAAPADAVASDNAPETDTAADLGNFPSRNISWIVPAPAGAPLDLPTRVIMEAVDLGANIMIENIPGAGNVPGILEASNRAADGYTILTTNTGGMVAQPALIHTGYVPSDFRHIAMLMPVYAFPVVVSADSDIHSAEDFVSFVTSGESFNYSATNPGSTSHLAIISALDGLGSTAGTFVPYVGGAEVLAAVLNGEIDFGVIPPHMARPNAESGATRTVIVLADEPDLMSPGIPVISEFGVNSVGRFNNTIFVSVHADTPEVIVQYLKERINTAILSDEYQDYLRQTTGIDSFDTVTEEWLTEHVSFWYETISEALEEFGLGQ